MPPVRPFFYFNGFNSAIPDDYSDNPKITAVARFAEARGFRFTAVSICYRRAAEQVPEVLDMVPASSGEAVFCGSSMGGWFARIVQLKLSRTRPGVRTAAVGFNPAYDLSMHAYLLLGPQQNHVTLENYVWTSEHSAALRSLETSVDYSAPLPFFVYLDKGDEVIGWERSAARHRPIARLLAFDGGCHSFEHFHEALADFDRSYLQRSAEPDQGVSKREFPDDDSPMTS
jgi:predicted esterase YcpF (UPF0227 family)